MQKSSLYQNMPQKGNGLSQIFCQKLQFQCFHRGEKIKVQNGGFLCEFGSFLFYRYLAVHILLI